MQEFSSKRFGDESGAAVIMDVETGAVKALTSMPAYDPNIFSRGISHEYWNELHSNPKLPLINKSLAGQYPPGSTFKMLVAIAALEEGIINQYTNIHCGGSFWIGKHRFNCWKEHGHGAVNLNKAIAESCDTYFYTIADKMGIEKISEVARRFGLGEIYNVGISGEKEGLIPNKEWKKKRHNERWQRGDTINSSIGQGYVLSTPLQLAVMTARIANGGYDVTPTIYQSEVDKLTKMPVNEDKSDTTTDEQIKQKYFEKTNINPEHLKLIQKAMFSVVNKPNGTAYRSRFSKLGDIKMAGKTGTSQVRRITKRGVDQDTIPWKERHHALFVGYAPFDKPKYAAAVIVEHGGGGSKAAAPIVRDILEHALGLE